MPPPDRRKIAVSTPTNRPTTQLKPFTVNMAIKAHRRGQPVHHYESRRYLTAAIIALVVANLLSLGAILVRDVDATETVSEMKLRGSVQ